MVYFFYFSGPLWIPASLLNGLPWLNKVSYLLERQASTGREAFFTLKRLDRTKFDLISVLTLIEMICPNFGKTTTQECK